MNKLSQLLAYVQMLDSAFPIGSFSHSFGLETFVQHGKINSLPQLEHYMKAQLQASIIPLDVLTVQGIYEVLDELDLLSLEQPTMQQQVSLQQQVGAGELAGVSPTAAIKEQLIRLDGICHTQRTARESREGLHKMGKRLIRLGKNLYPTARLQELETLLLQERGYGTYPTVFAWIAWHLKLEQQLAVSGYLYTSIQMMVNSALRLMSLGQTDGQLLISSTVQYGLSLWEEMKQHGYTGPFSYGLVQEIAAMQHETLYSRLFMS